MGLIFSSTDTPTPPPSLVESILSQEKHKISSPTNPSILTSTSLLIRQAQIFYLAATIFLDYKIVQWRCDQIDDTSEGETFKNLIWDQAHDRNSVFLANNCINLKALWVKFGQYLSSRADVMPEAYINALAKCQDSLPPPNFKDTLKRIEKELNCSSASIFKHIEETPLAVASIASVYRATLLNDTQVVIKIQHDDVKDKLLLDLQCLETIGNTIRYLDPDFDMSPVIREWAKEVPRELDFINEAENMKNVTYNLLHTSFQRETPIQVSLAKVIEEYTNEKLLIMSFIDGFKVNDLSQLDEYNLNRSELMLNIIRSYAHQIFIDGLFSADPHPGNIMLNKVTKEVTLLDFGLTKKLSKEIRLSFAQLLVAASEADIYGIFNALDKIGLKLNTDVPFDINLLMRFLFRDAKPRVEAKVESQARRDEYKKTEKMKKKFYIGDKVNVFKRNMFGVRHSYKGEIIAVSSSSSSSSLSSSKLSDGDSSVSIRYTDGHEEQGILCSQISLQKSRSPIDAWPDAFIFFDRVLTLLRGLCASLDVTQSYLDVMTPYARHALQIEYSSSSSSSSISNITSTVDQVNASSILDQLISSGEVLGCQFAVTQRGCMIVDICGGIANPYTNTHVTSNTVFNSFSVTKGIAATCIHILVDQGKISLSDPISKHWPEFAMNNKQSITIEHVLNHESGLSSAAEEELLDDPFIVTDNALMIRLMQEATPTHAPGDTIKYHYLSFGWILDGIVSKVTGLNMKEFAKMYIADKLDLSSEFSIGLTEDEASEVPNATLVLAQPREIMKPRETSTSTSEDDAVANQKKRPSSSKVSMLMNPTFFNNPRIRGSVMPAATGHFSARALAKFYSSLLPSSALSLFNAESRLIQDLKTKNDSMKTKISNEQMLQGEEGRLSLGYTLYPIDSGDGTCFGHGGLGGSIAFCDPINELSVALTVNRLNFNPAGARSLIRHVYQALQLTPPSFLK